MTQREKLIELLPLAVQKCRGSAGGFGDIADYLIANGVVVLPCRVGDELWIVERDDDGEPYDVSGYIYIASCLQSVIVSPIVNGPSDICDIVDYFIEQTVESYSAELAVFPIEDCYVSREEAEKALEKRKGGE